jgi:hypothetical protein
MPQSIVGAVGLEAGHQAERATGNELADLVVEDWSRPGLTDRLESTDQAAG